MTQKKKPTVMILEHDEEIREHAKSILIKAGWDVVCEQVSKNALNTLSKSVTQPFALFICSYKLPKMDGDDILREVRAISPLTQRMLLVPADKLETLISAIHKAKIHACITSPFKDNDLNTQARICFKQFKRAKKMKHIKREALHQNRQMLQIAQTLKKKDAKYTKIIAQKKSELLQLKSEKRELGNNPATDISLMGIMKQKGIKPAPDIFQNEFINICKIIRDLFNKLTSLNDSDSVTLDFSTILNPEQDKEQNNKGDALESIKKIINAALSITETKTDSSDLSISDPQETGIQKSDGSINEPFEISFSKNYTKATIKKNSAFEKDAPQTTLADILELLKEKQIAYGIVEDITIESWIEKSFEGEIVIAKGEDPVPGYDGKVKFNFETEFTNPGKINEDGSIDFTQRGDIPFVNKGEVMAVKKAAKEGKAGIDIAGNPIQVPEIIDPVFTAGSGTELSEDELTITASIDGQPNLDAMGSVTVNPELAIPGDVNFETGSIDFKGNIVVNGTIKEGFTVKGVNLMAKEIAGATIELSGDLNISAGVTDAKISTQGNIYAKFINNSNIMTFGNLEISKEIIDSDIISSGSCQNQSGHIITSRITTKMGIEAGKIGTASAKPAKLKIGVDEHMEILTGKIQKSLEASVNKTDLLKDEIKKLEDEDQKLYLQVSEKAHIQDRSQLDIKELKNSGQADDSMEIKKLQNQAKKAEQELNKIFEAQDKIADDIKRLKEQVSFAQKKTKTFVLEKKALNNFANKEKPIPVVNIAQTIVQDTMIKGPNSSLILKEDASRCKIQELTVDYDGVNAYEMTISDP